MIYFADGHLYLLTFDLSGVSQGLKKKLMLKTHTHTHTHTFAVVQAVMDTCRPTPFSIQSILILFKSNLHQPGQHVCVQLYGSVGGNWNRAHPTRSSEPHLFNKLFGFAVECHQTIIINFYNETQIVIGTKDNK